MEWYVMVWQRYAQFSGRSRRKEYWMFTLVHSILFLLLYGVGVVALMNHNLVAGGALILLFAIYVLASLVPTLAVSVRRLHDINKSGWWMLLCLVPFGSIVILVFTCIDSDPGDNQYGPSPGRAPAPLLVG